MRIAVTNPIEISPGNVPRAKSESTRAPVMKFPVLTAYICMARVNQHGKKNVRTHVMKAEDFVFPSPFIFFPKNFGSVGEKWPIRGERLVRLSPRRSMTIPTRAVMSPRNVLEKWIMDPKNQRIPPRNPKPITLPK